VGTCATPDRRGDRDRAAGRLGTGPRAFTRPDPPRHQAREHPAASAGAFADALTTRTGGLAQSLSIAELPSVAVLPFLNLSTDPENEFFTDGITEDVIAQLSKIRSLKVISRTSVMPFKQREQSLREIGATLQVGTLLEGSVRRAGDRVRIVAQLIGDRPARVGGDLRPAAHRHLRDSDGRVAPHRRGTAGRAFTRRANPDSSGTHEGPSRLSAVSPGAALLCPVHGGEHSHLRPLRVAVFRARAVR
jgi:TolB-like protein